MILGPPKKFSDQNCGFPWPKPCVGKRQAGENLRPAAEYPLLPASSQFLIGMNIADKYQIPFHMIPLSVRTISRTENEAIVGDMPSFSSSPNL
jgi:hypothetical protein